jgi:DNA-formamidopyrimidine glycosylase
MPEGPEVRRIVERLDKFYQGREITAIDFYDESYKSKQVRDDVDLFVNSLPATVNSVKCKGKFIYWTFDNGFVIFHTLGMSGTWRIQDKNPKYGRLCFIRDDGKKCHYKDYRRFGTFKILQPDLAQERLERKLVKELGPDILNEEVSFDSWQQRFRKVNHYNVTKAMMNQKVVAGIGNYIKAEALYRAKISPHRTVESLSDEELHNLYRCSLWVIKASYEARGATIRNYEMPDGTKGDFKFNFQVYAQETDPAGRLVIRDKTPDGRTTHWVKEIQA